jgi:small-conductance mechanosensitive channel
MVGSTLRYAVDRLFREHHVEIPFPQRDLHIRAGDASLQVALSRGLEVKDADGEVLLEADPEKQKASRGKG